MRIRAKFVLIVVPLLITPLLLVGFAASLAARNGITRIATEFLKFKSEELKNYATTQWNLLVENQLDARAEYVEVSKTAVTSFARSLIRSESELIIALDEQGRIAMSTAEIQPSEQEVLALVDLVQTGEEGWIQIRLAGIPRVAQIVRFGPFGWTFLVTEHRDVFYEAVNQIYFQSGFILIMTLAVTLLLLYVFVRYLTQPLGNVVSAMKEIIGASDLSKRVELQYKDEIGDLGHTFNLMTGQLEKAYNQIKSYAFKAVIAQKREQKIRNIFQKYVPADVIDQFFTNPESMLIGESRILAVLFSDIRGFTSISESMPPEQIVESLNTYFSAMVDIIMNRRGIVDKYIGDAIMAFFGAPVKHEDDVSQAVNSGFDMLDALKAFNSRQAKRNRPQFRIGIGLNYGLVTVGNIGSEKKMDYTVIGDMVNLASRLEGLTKVYDVPFLVSESIYAKVKKEIPCRLVDRVQVKGKKQVTRIFYPKKKINKAETRGWKLHHMGMNLYYKREFDKAIKYFVYAREFLANDPILPIYLARCKNYVKNPPPANWQGLSVISET
ncbi:MAG: HAMP domain-containing protein [Spirochaetaceae bacterium]|nr:MAG: HAMP domain-containing protein [Spirochaetaceae bacterium]